MVGGYQFCDFYHISLIAGILDVRRMLDFGITAGLGTSKISYHFHSTFALKYELNYCALVFRTKVERIVQF